MFLLSTGARALLSRTRLVPRRFRFHRVRIRARVVTRPSVVALFSKLDALKLERIVGSARCAKMTAKNEHPMFLFV